MVIVITGGSSGIGLVTAEYLASKGHTVYALSRTVRSLSHVTSYSCDVTNEGQVASCLAKVNEAHGLIDVIINNAGMGISGAFEHHPASDIDSLLNINIKGVLNVSRLGLPYLRASKGRLINIGSVAGELAIPFQTIYSASKGFISTFSEGLANEVKPFGVKVSCVLPGDTRTNFTANRKKNPNQGLYEARVERSLAKMEHDEIHGVSPLKVAKVIEKCIQKKHPPLKIVVGFDYKLLVFLKRFLPTKLVNAILYSMYGK